MVGTAGAALGTNLINNVPMAVVMISALAGIQHAPPVIQHGFIAATMFGCDLGPNLTTVGSLATVLWLLILRHRFPRCRQASQRQRLPLRRPRHRSGVRPAQRRGSLHRR